MNRNLLTDPASMLAMHGTLLAVLVADGDLATCDRLSGLPGLRSVARLVPGPDGIPLLVIE